MNKSEAQKILSAYRPIDERSRAARREIKRLGLENDPVLIDKSNTARRMYAMDAKRLGRYDGDTSGGVFNIVAVPFTAEESAAIAEWREAVDASNAMWQQVKMARMVIDLLTGMRMASKFAGVSSLTQRPFSAGTEIFYARTNMGALVAPVSELDGAR